MAQGLNRGGPVVLVRLFSRARRDAVSRDLADQTANLAVFRVLGAVEIEQACAAIEKPAPAELRTGNRRKCSKRSPATSVRGGRPPWPRSDCHPFAVSVAARLRPGTPRAREAATRPRPHSAHASVTVTSLTATAPSATRRCTSKLQRPVLVGSRACMSAKSLRTTIRSPEHGQSITHSGARYVAALCQSLACIAAQNALPAPGLTWFGAYRAPPVPSPRLHASRPRSVVGAVSATDGSAKSVRSSRGLVRSKARQPRRVQESIQRWR